MLCFTTIELVTPTLLQLRLLLRQLLMLPLLLMLLRVLLLLLLLLLCNQERCETECSTCKSSARKIAVVRHI